MHEGWSGGFGETRALGRIEAPIRPFGDIRDKEPKSQYEMEASDQRSLVTDHRHFETVPIGLKRVREYIDTGI